MFLYLYSFIYVFKYIFYTLLYTFLYVFYILLCIHFCIRFCICYCRRLLICVPKRVQKTVMVLLIQNIMNWNVFYWYVYQKETEKTQSWFCLYKKCGHCFADTNAVMVLLIWTKRDWISKVLCIHTKVMPCLDWTWLIQMQFLVLLLWTKNIVMVLLVLANEMTGHCFPYRRES